MNVKNVGKKDINSKYFCTAGIYYCMLQNSLTTDEMQCYVKSYSADDLFISSETVALSVYLLSVLKG